MRRKVRRSLKSSKDNECLYKIRNLEKGRTRTTNPNGQRKELNTVADNGQVYRHISVAGPLQ